MGYYAICIFGPTGVGKTNISLKLAKDIGEIISCDSMQVYKYMDIGSAKIKESQMMGIPHHLINFTTPDNQFTAGDFKRYCETNIPLIIERGKIPFIVGGTGFYFSTLINGIVDIPEINEKIKNRVRNLGEKRSKEHIYRMLEIVDSETYKRLHKNDKQRILRALEVYFGTGIKLSEFYKKERNRKDIKYLKIGLDIDRKLLYERIDKRVDLMIEDGLIEEVKKLLEMGYKKNMPGMMGIGYKEIVDYIEGNITLNDAIDLIKKNSRHYAKRQFTWFRNMADVIWVNYEDFDNIKKIIDDFISRNISGLD